jgi:DNA polymerase-3 subunit delta
MSGSPPVIYLVHGDDEFAIAGFITDLEKRLGDPGLAAMNTSRLDGRTCSLDELLGVAAQMPFLAARRIVILDSPLARLTTPEAQQKFLSTLAKIPASTALVLVEYRLLTEKKERDRGKLHWLEKWAKDEKERVHISTFIASKDLTSWIIKRAKTYQGSFDSDAASLLGSLVGSDPRLADQEIQKLLAYVNYQRPVQFEDVEYLTANSSQADIFALVDALGGQQGQRALGLLQRLLEQDDPASIFGMIIRQFRLLIQGRAIIDRSGSAANIAEELHLHPYVAEKVAAQARKFTLPALAEIYHKLLDIDLEIKTGEIPADVAMDTFVAAFAQ